MSPIQAAIVRRAIEIVFSDVGHALRKKMMTNSERLRAAMQSYGLECAGQVSPIVPVLIGNEKLARLTARELARTGLQANLVEFPAVARGKARFRFQIMATHTDVMIDQACGILAKAKAKAASELFIFEVGWKKHTGEMKARKADGIKTRETRE
jgi:7-keto-8-aminopelargonate synthetase-like enzyme